MRTKQSFLPVVLVPSCVLLIPAAAMLFNLKGWAWSGFDFVIFWLLIAGAVFVYRLVSNKIPNRTYSVATGLAVIAGFVLLWVNAAVGLIGSDDNPANLLYGGVLLIGGIGAALARLEPLGMARALFAMALAQFLVPVVALLLWRSDFSPGVAQVFGLNSFFVLMFAASAMLFRHAAGQPEVRREAMHG
jgi:hypothetical protein